MPDYTQNLLRIMREMDDPSVVAEIYASDAVPGIDGFNPANAIKRYAGISDLTFAGQNYTRLVNKFGNVKRTITAEVNSASVEFSNLSHEIARFEFAEGFEGLIKVIRLISRSQSLLLSDSLILFVGRCDKPKSGNKLSLSVSAKHILGSTEAELPRRKFTVDDAAGRTPQDVLFEGFRFMPQYGAVSYSTREKRGGLLGFLGFKKTVTYNLPWSSFSDLDAEKFLPEVGGRVQAIGTHVGYADVGTNIQMLTAFCEGEIQDFFNARSVTPGFTLNPDAYYEVYGKLGGVGDQVPDPNWIAPGYYSRTAHIRCNAFGSSVQSTDPAPDVVSVILGRSLFLVDASGNITTINGFDNGTAQTRFYLTSPDYYKLHPAWIDNPSFWESARFNDEIIFDSSYSDTLFVPDSAGFAPESEALMPFFASTAMATAEYFQFLNGDKNAAETFLLNPKTTGYDTGIDSPIEPPDPDPEPGPGGGNEGNLLFFLRRRFTSNYIVTEQIKLIDFFHQTLFPASRLFFTQGINGKIKIKNKKPVDWALSTSSAGGLVLNLDDVSKWIGNFSGSLLVDPHTAQSEVREVTGAAYSFAGNSIPLSASANIGVSGFSGGNGAGIAATAQLTVNSRVDANSFSLNAITINFTAGETDTTQTIAAFIYGSINGHPKLQRAFVAAWTPGTSVVTIYAKFGTLALNSSLELIHSAPVVDPAVEPNISAASGGTFKAGTYQVAYSYANHRGQTLFSPVSEVTLANNQRISVAAVTPPSGADVVWYCSPAEDSRKLRFHSRNNGTAFIINVLPRLSAALPPDLNRTNAEVMRVSQVFSDRAESRSNRARANVLKATFKWLLGNREKSVNAIECTFRDSTLDWKLSRILLRDDDHIDKTKKVSTEKINGAAIDSYHQAYRIASGIRAERRDADFFYEWTADREALLLEEGDVVCITDSGAEVYNLPVRIESIEFGNLNGFPTAAFVARKYSTTLYDDSVAERQIPVIVETANAQAMAALEVTYAPSNFTETRALDAGTATLPAVANTLATLMDDIENNRK